MTIYSPERTNSKRSVNDSFRITIFDGIREFSAGLVDLSRSGARLMVEAPLERGLQILLRIYLVKAEGDCLSVSAETRWRRQLSRVAQYELGVRFTFEDESQRQQVALLVEHYVAGRGSEMLDGRERRIDPRVKIPR